MEPVLISRVEFAIGLAYICMATCHAAVLMGYEFNPVALMLAIDLAIAAAHMALAFPPSDDNEIRPDPA
jgi:hypothetical protein